MSVSPEHGGPIRRPPGGRGTAPSAFPFFAIRAGLLCAGVALIVVADVRGALRLAAWCLIVAPLAGELAGSLLYLCARPRGGRRDGSA